jgi:hypothetical protein
MGAAALQVQLLQAQHVPALRFSIETQRQRDSCRHSTPKPGTRLPIMASLATKNTADSSNAFEMQAKLCSVNMGCVRCTECHLTMQE